MSTLTDKLVARFEQASSDAEDQDLDIQSTGDTEVTDGEMPNVPEVGEVDDEEINQSNAEDTPRVIKLPDGREMTLEELEDLQVRAERYAPLQAEFTRRSQRLAELERLQQENAQKQNAPTPEEPDKALSDEDIDKRIRDEKIKRQLQQEYGLISKAEVEKLFEERDRKLQQAEQYQRLQAEARAREQAVNQSVEELKEEYNGIDGKPKFNEVEVLNWLEEKGYKEPTKTDKETYKRLLKFAYQEINADQLNSKPVKTEVKSTPTVPKGQPVKELTKSKTPKTLQDAKNSFIARLTANSST